MLNIEWSPPTQSSPDVAGCVWLDMRSDWLDLILPALSYLSAEVGAVSSFDPLPFFLPVVEFRDRIDHWKWMGEPPPSTHSTLPPPSLTTLPILLPYLHSPPSFPLLQAMIVTVKWSYLCYVITGWTPWTDLW